MHPSQRKDATGEEKLIDLAMAHYRRLLRDYAEYDPVVGPYLMSRSHSRERHLGVLQGLLAAACSKAPDDFVIQSMIETQVNAIREEQP